MASRRKKEENRLGSGGTPTTSSSSTGINSRSTTTSTSTAPVVGLPHSNPNILPSALEGWAFEFANVVRQISDHSTMLESSSSSNSANNNREFVTLQIRRLLRRAASILERIRQRCCPETCTTTIPSSILYDCHSLFALACQNNYNTVILLFSDRTHTHELWIQIIDAYLELRTTTNRPPIIVSASDDNTTATSSSAPSNNYLEAILEFVSNYDYSSTSTTSIPTHYSFRTTSAAAPTMSTATSRTHPATHTSTPILLHKLHHVLYINLTPVALEQVHPALVLLWLYKLLHQQLRLQTDDRMMMENNHQDPASSTASLYPALLIQLLLRHAVSFLVSVQEDENNNNHNTDTTSIIPNQLMEHMSLWDNVDAHDKLQDLQDLLQKFVKNTVLVRAMDTLEEVAMAHIRKSRTPPENHPPSTFTSCLSSTHSSASVLAIHQQALLWVELCIDVVEATSGWALTMWRSVLWSLWRSLAHSWSNQWDTDKDAFPLLHRIMSHLLYQNTNNNNDNTSVQEELIEHQETVLLTLMHMKEEAMDLVPVVLQYSRKDREVKRLLQAWILSLVWRSELAAYPHEIVNELLMGLSREEKDPWDDAFWKHVVVKSRDEE